MSTSQNNIYQQSIQSLLVKFGIAAPDIMIDDLVLDSRDVAIHKAFVAIIGHSLDGRDFIPQAISLGAKVIICETEIAEEHGQIHMREQSLLISFYQLSASLSALAVEFYQAPAQHLQVVAVTGTNGKTSTVQLSSQLASLLGQKAATIGTLGTGITSSLGQNTGLDLSLNTTPDAISMQRLLANFVAQEAEQVCFEASSHALVQGRIAALKTDVAVFTNLSRDHLDYHGTMSAYGAAKRLLLSQPGLRFALVNANDPESASWLEALPSSAQSIVYGIDLAIDELPKGQRYCSAIDIRYHSRGCNLTLASSWGRAELSLQLLGHFNVSNALAAIAVQLCLGHSLQNIQALCAKLSPVPGRMECFVKPELPTVVVDFAHTPDALMQTLVALREHCDGSLWCIFGCGGDRDQGKRSLMGEIAERHADHVTITNDNSRTEDPALIAKQILSGCSHPKKISVELSREQAITQALAMAGSKDIIVVAGKGHENYQIIGEHRIDYDERAFVKQLLERNAA